MGKKGTWLGAVKKVFSPESKEKKGQKRKSKKRWVCGRCSDFDSESFEESVHNNSAPPPPHPRGNSENEQSKHAYSVALASAVAAEAAAVAAQAAAEVVRLTKSSTFAGITKEEAAAIKIQTAFRGYLARRALRALRGLVRLKSLTNSDSVKRQAAATLRCMQMLARVQSQIHSRRLRMSEENQAIQRQLQLKHERELEKLKMSEEWDDSLQSKEQIEMNLQNKQEGAIRRERALAYAFSHQWKSFSRSANPTFMDPTNPQWGWSWMERWMAARPWENRNLTNKDNTDRASMKSASRSLTPSEITRVYARRPSTPSKPPSISKKKIRSASPRSGWAHLEEDSNSIASVQSEMPRRHSIGGSSVKDDESLGSCVSVPSYMALTVSAKAKSRFQSPSNSKMDTSSEKGSVSSARKRLSFPGMGTSTGVDSPATVRRHSGPPKVDAALTGK